MTANIEDLDRQAKEMLEYIDQLIANLQIRRRQLVRAQRWALDEHMDELLAIIRKNPGINASKLFKKTKLNTQKDYSNTMTSLRRRNLIINKGTRSRPLWYCV